jgi:predicted RNA-binding protein YlqC (UPF0109 family)
VSLELRAEAYLRALIEPLMEAHDHGKLVIQRERVERVLEADGRSEVITIVVFRARIPRTSVRYIVGRHGATADAIRTLVRGWAGANGFKAKIDVDVRAQ